LSSRFSQLVLSAASIAIVAIATISLAACEEKQPGRLLAQGLGRDVMAAPGGGSVAFFLDATHPDDRAVPQDLFIGDLWLADLHTQNAAVRVGSGVATIPGNTVYRPDGGAIAWLGSFRFHTGEGDLIATTIEGAATPRKLATSATTFAWAPRGDGLAWISQGRLFVSPHPFTSEALLPAVEGAQQFIWSPDGKSVAVRAPGRGRVVLLNAETGLQRELTGDSSDFLFASDGTLGILSRPITQDGGRVLHLGGNDAAEEPHADRRLSLLEPGKAELTPAGYATAFLFSPDAKQLLTLSTPGDRGESFGDLTRTQRGAAPTLANHNGQLLGQRVNEYRFGAKGDLLFLSGYDTRERGGTLMLAPASGAAPREIAKHVQTFQLSPIGDRVLYTVQNATKQDFKVELWTAELATDASGFGRAARKIDEGVYGYLLSPDGTTLFWKSRCAGSRACELLRAPIATTSEPTTLATLVAGFDFAPATGRLLISHPHKSAARAVDLTLQDGFGPRPEHAPDPFVTEADPSSRFLDAEGHHVLAPILSSHNPSVRVIELP
jgi:hypothetical protein